MWSQIERFDSGWVGITICLGPKEIDKLIDALKALKCGKIGHFHFRSNELGGEAGIADIEISLKGPRQPDNLTIE
jgi:hypothetical protein